MIKKFIHLKTIHCVSAGWGRARCIAVPLADHRPGLGLVIGCWDPLGSYCEGLASSRKATVSPLRPSPKASRTPIIRKTSPKLGARPRGIEKPGG